MTAIEKRKRVFTIITFHFCLISRFLSVDPLYGHKDCIDCQTMLKFLVFLYFYLCICVVGLTIGIKVPMFAIPKLEVFN